MNPLAAFATLASHVHHFQVHISKLEFCFLDTGTLHTGTQDVFVGRCITRREKCIYMFKETGVSRVQGGIDSLSGCVVQMELFASKAIDLLYTAVFPKGFDHIDDI